MELSIWRWYNRLNSLLLFSLVMLSGCKGTIENDSKEDAIYISSLLPERGIAGDTIKIRGKNFVSSMKVKFGNYTAEKIDSNDTEIITIVPEGVESNVPVSLFVEDKKSNSWTFYFDAMETIQLADPTIFLFNDTFYLYGTGGKEGNVDHGFLVYSSSDLRRWKRPVGSQNGFALTRDNNFGDWGFWAPQVFAYKGEIYMAYTANENIAIAKSNSPIGPFKEYAVLKGPTRQIDPYIFIDDDGKVYIYFVKLSSGNKLYVAEMTEDLTAIKQETTKLCIEAYDLWEDIENAGWKVVEGPTVLKEKNKYYLFYSANDYRNKDYAVGYAVSNSPRGPWVRYKGNPVISRSLIGINGPGHGDFFKDKKGDFIYVFHTHFNNSDVHPRLTAIMKGDFVEETEQDVYKMSFKKETFKFLFQSN